MSKKLSIFTPISGWLFNRRKRKYARLIETMKEPCNLNQYTAVLEVGCRTGALCAAMHEIGLEVTGVDVNAKRLKKAKKHNADTPITFVEADVFKGLPFKNKSFDVVITSYLAHEFDKEKRTNLYQEMERLAKEKVIIHDRNTQRTPLITFSEFDGGGHYQQFIESFEREMEACLNDMKKCFEDVEKFDINISSAWYVCTPLSK